MPHNLAMQSLRALLPIKKITCSIILIASAVASTALTHTLDEQYEYFLAAQCAHLGFERTEDQNILPGQAGPNLYAYCNGPPAQEMNPPGTSVSTASIGGASAGGGKPFVDASLGERHEAGPDGNAQLYDTGIAQLGRLGLFMSTDYAREKHAANTYQAGQRVHREGLLTGGDYRFDKFVFGLALKHQRNKGDFDNGGGLDGRSTGALVYGAWYATNNTSLDIAFGQDRGTEHKQRSVARQRIYRFRETVAVLTEDGPIEVLVEHEPRVVSEIEPRLAWGRYRSRTRFAVLGAQMETYWQRYSLNYRLALRHQVHHNSGYTEAGETPMTLVLDANQYASLRGMLGISGHSAYSFSKGVWIVQANLEWLKEFRDEQPWLTAHFAEDIRPNPKQLRFLGPSPEREWLQASLGTSVILPSGLSAFLMFDRTLSHKQMRRAAISLGLRLEI